MPKATYIGTGGITPIGNDGKEGTPYVVNRGVKFPAGEAVEVEKDHAAFLGALSAFKVSEPKKLK